jgi:ferritin-like protein
MAASSANLHEDSLSPATVNRHRAIVSLMEELEAIDWYAQRVEATEDDSLGAILAHNRDDEKEHAAMILEWLRRHDAALATELRTYLFTDVPVTEVAASGPGSGAPAEGSLGIGSLKGMGDR